MKFTRCVVLVNPKGTHAARGQRFAEQLRQQFTDTTFEIIETKQTDFEKPAPFVRKLNTKLDEHTLLSIAGGDGTLSAIINLLLTHKGFSAEARRAVVLPLWGGNANDLAYMANGLAAFTNVHDILANGRPAEVFPLRIKANKQTKANRLAVCYVSFGASAYATYHLNHPNHRNKSIYKLPGVRLLFEAGRVTKALVDARLFKCEIDGVTQPLYDLMLINGSRIAKVDRAPIKLTDSYFYEIRTKRKKPVILAYATSVLRNITPKHAPIATRTLTAHDATWAQLDGEVYHIPANTTISVTLFDQPVRLLSTRL